MKGKVVTENGADNGGQTGCRKSRKQTGPDNRQNLIIKQGGKTAGQRK